ncbi:hypothetical protein DVH24_032231 [Malus domestica]|uniref:S-locus receptor kinase C-terminal domain-containing protein n=1 Tax=Malus domestica TaxID=3750 RepID=A0A498J6K4_MALDO|nr:hypothetical protein DVH24_032231 [Malus domestica]
MKLDEALRCIHAGFLCVQEAPADRPTMSLVIRMLQGNESTSLPPSKEPAFSTHGNSSLFRSSPTHTSFSHNAVTMSLPKGVSLWSMVGRLGLTVGEGSGDGVHDWRKEVGRGWDGNHGIQQNHMAWQGKKMEKKRGMGDVERRKRNGGFLCVQEAPADRPTMSSIIRMMQGNESTSLPPSKEPAFSTHRNFSHVHSSETPTIFSQNTVTMSLPEGR